MREKKCTRNRDSGSEKDTEDVQVHEKQGRGLLASTYVCAAMHPRDTRTHMHADGRTERESGQKMERERGRMKRGTARREEWERRKKQQENEATERTTARY